MFVVVAVRDGGADLLTVELAETRERLGVDDNERDAFELWLAEDPNDTLCVIFALLVIVRDAVAADERVTVAFGVGAEPALAVVVCVDVGEFFVGEELIVIVLVVVALGLRLLAEVERLNVAAKEGI